MSRSGELTRSFYTDRKRVAMLRELARFEPSERAQLYLRQLAPKATEWDSFMQLAAQEQVEPLVARHGLSIDELAPRAVDSLERIRQRSLYFLLLCDQHVTPVFAEFARQQIDVIALKGLYLANAVYPEPWMRSMSDVDLLIRPEDGARADTVMQQLGFERYLVYPNRPHKEQQLHQRCWFRRIHSGMNLVVELHSAIIHPGRFSVDSERLWQRSEAWDFGGFGLRRLEDNDLWVHLMLHIAAHSFKLSLRSLVDLHELYLSRPIDWDGLVARIEQAGCKSIAYYVLRSLLYTFWLEVPAPVFRALRPPLLHRLYLDRWINATTPPLRKLAGLPLSQLTVFLPLLDSFAQRRRTVFDDLRSRLQDLRF